MCDILTNYLEPYTPRIMNILIRRRYENAEQLKELLNNECLVVRKKGYKDNSNELILELYNTIINTSPNYLDSTLIYDGIFVSLKKQKGYELVYEFVNNWSSKYIYFENINLNISPNVFIQLRKTVTNNSYNCYRGLNFNKKDLVKFFNDVEIKNDKRITINTKNYTSWTTN